MRISRLLGILLFMYVAYGTAFSQVTKVASAAVQEAPVKWGKPK